LLGPKTHFYLPYSIYLLIFLSQLIREKSGKVGQSASNRCNYWVSAGPLLKMKPGQSPLFLGQNRFSSQQTLHKYHKTQIKMGQTQFLISQNGPKIKKIKKEAVASVDVYSLSKRFSALDNFNN
jgi:hypothetical protein